MGAPIGPQAVDESRAYRITLAGSYAQPSLAGRYDGTEAIAARIWPGGAYAAVAAPAAEWEADPAELDSPAILLTVSAADLEGVEPGTYQYEVRIDADEIAATGSIRLTPGSSGTAVLPRTYCTLADMEAECSWVGSVESLEARRAVNFVHERARAARWAESMALGRRRHAAQEQARRHGGVSYETPVAITSGVDAGPGWGVSIYPDSTHRLAESEFAADLAAHGLMADYGADGEELRRMTALMALHYALDDQLGGAPGGETSLQAIGRAYWRQAQHILAGLVLRISTETDEDAEGYGVPTYELAP